MDIVDRIKELKERRQAVILAHNYTAPEVQDIADYTGDSLGLSIIARDVKAPVIVFAGVRFMAETAKILSPEATVLLPAVDAGCPMADMAAPEDVAAIREAHPDAILVAYVNTTAATKAHVDICCTSANAHKVLASLPEDAEVIFLPDRNLGANVGSMLNREMQLWPGYCPIHDKIQLSEMRQARADHPGAVVMVHPECSPAVVSLADVALSTGGMLDFVKKSDATEFIVGTECGILHRLQLDNPDKKFYLLPSVPTCQDMKKITLEQIEECLETLEPAIELPKELMDKARLPIERMLNLK